MTNKYLAKSGTHATWTGAYKYFIRYFDEDIKMGELSVRLIEEYKAHLMDSELSKNTQNIYFGKFKTAIKRAYQKNYIYENFSDKVDGIKGEESKREFLTIEELKILATTNHTIKPVIRNAFLFSAITGLRFIDCKRLKWKNLQSNADSKYFLRYKQHKISSQETLPLNRSALKYLGERRGEEQPIFKDLNYSTWMNKQIGSWVEAAGIKKKITFHCARHTFATMQITEGTDIYTVSKLLGHKSVKTTQIYSKVIDSKKVEAMNRLDGII